MPARRRACVPGASRTNGGASSRADTASRDCSVADQLDSGRRGGNCLSSAAAAGTEPAPGPIRGQGLRGHAVPCPNRMFSVCGRYEAIGGPTSGDGCAARFARR